MGLTTSAFGKVFIGSSTYPTANFDGLAAADYATDTYTQIKEVNDIPEFGDMAQEVKFDSIDSGRTLKLKGNRDAGDFDLKFGFDATDPGTLALMAASQDNFNRSFKVVFNDAPTLTGKPTTYFFRGLVMSTRQGGFAANNMLMMVAKIAINGAPVTVPASA